jgi:hypothetical protein
MMDGNGEPVWTEEALRRVEKAPAFVRPGIYKLMVKRAKERGRNAITSTFLTEIRNESMLRVARCIRGFGFKELTMDAFEAAKQKMRKLPRKVEVIEEIQAFLGARIEKDELILAKFTRYLEMVPEQGLPWTEEALVRLQQVPTFVREMARQVIEKEAKRRKEKVITPEVVDQTCGVIFLGPFAGGRRAEAVAAGEASLVERRLEEACMLWTDEATDEVTKIPIALVRRMIVQRVEAYAKNLGLEVVDRETYRAGRQRR